MSTADNEFDLESFVNALGLNTRGSFNGNCEHCSNSSVDNPSLKIASQIDSDKHLGQAQTKIISSRYNEKSPFVERSSNGVDWNIAAVICGYDSSGFSDGAFCGSGSLDGASRGFWEISWDTLHDMWNQTRSSGILSWPYKPDTSRARLERRKGNDPLRLHVDLEGYDSVVTFRVIKEKLKQWLVLHKGYCTIMGPGFRSNNSST